MVGLLRRLDASKVVAARRLTGISESDVCGCATIRCENSCSTADLAAGTKCQEGTVLRMPLYIWSCHPDHLKIPQEVGHWIQRNMPQSKLVTRQN